MDSLQIQHPCHRWRGLSSFPAGVIRTLIPRIGMMLTCDNYISVSRKQCSVKLLQLCVLVDVLLIEFHPPVNTPIPGDLYNSLLTESEEVNWPDDNLPSPTLKLPNLAAQTLWRLCTQQPHCCRERSSIKVRCLALGSVQSWDGREGGILPSVQDRCTVIPGDSALMPLDQARGAWNGSLVSSQPESIDPHLRLKRYFN